MSRIFLTAVIVLMATMGLFAQPDKKYNLKFDHLATRWDEAMPLGNGMLGALVWQKQGKLRLSLDRADLWDERKALDLSTFNFKDVERWVRANNYDSAHKLGDAPYDEIPYPTKLPAAAMEFSIEQLGNVVSNELDLATALNTVKFASGTIFNCYIHATNNIGYFSFENMPKNAPAIPLPELIVHNYNNNKDGEKDNSHAGGGLGTLGYAKGTVTKGIQTISYHQPTAQGAYFEVKIQWKKFPNGNLIGCWTVEKNKTANLPVLNLKSNEPTGWPTHKKWWQNFWVKSTVSVPDSIIQKQYLMEMYKLGAASRPNAPAITLQAVWTADNGSLPPWKGDFHNDLNTQLSYWPVYTSNHLTEGESYINWLWNNKTVSEKYTQQYFGVKGLNVPGVVTLNGHPMGGWIQYAMGPTVSAWCAQHLYWQWKYSMDNQFLKQKAYPFIHDAAVYLENITRIKDGKRYLPLSASPEFNDNNINAWFLDWTNFDLSLSKFLFAAAAEVARANNKIEEAKHWEALLTQLPELNTNETGLTVAPGLAQHASHRHMSPYMAIYPLGLLDANKPADWEIIQNTFKQLEKLGTRAWCGYSFSWMASLYARGYEAEKAAEQLRIFSTNFCSPNSFHLNGDQKGGQYSSMTYRPFTLEGNFAFAQGVHELLLQSRNGYIEIFPAVPADWKNVSFKNLRSEGAFIISAKKENGIPSEIKITAEKGGILKMKHPFKTWIVEGIPSTQVKKEESGILSVNMKKGQTIVFKNGYE
ncbi:MAG: glycoside hydrolase N-terminal domain-containing protein [Bacteroidetes bacterium]|nr:glycoside hydrolase N-terminal domain-containing protein [Bacteroidota bacterium]MBS1610462.1 glycoside hydrolase N-terminal domain-containing protein [Bacteroidota bacterium]